MYDKPDSFSDNLAIYNAFRAKIVAEDILINFRTSWTLWTQAVLISAWGVLASGPDRLEHIDVRFVFAAMFSLNGIGIYIVYAARRSIRAAIDEINQVKESYTNSYRELDESPQFPRLHSGPINFRDGSLLSRRMPWMLGFLQGLAMIAGIVSALKEAGLNN